MSVVIPLVLFLVFRSAQCSIKPNIIFILADDLGWNDVGFHGSGQIPTPNIDALAYAGLILQNYYVTPICTPSRTALMTGKYPIHLGTQHTVLYGAEARGLPLEEKILPQYLKDLGYSTRIVGKWHLGSFKKIYTPTFRGFDSHLGYWTGHQDYYDHTAVENPGWGFDMRRNLESAHDLHGQYSTDIFTREACRIIENHNKTNPLFLYLAHAAVHSGNPYEPLRAPDDVIDKFTETIPDYQRRKFAGILTKLDESVGSVVESLARNNLLQNSIIIFSTDNGGPAAGFNLNAASNYPLKGVKNTLWEGGVRGAALIWSPLIKKTKRVARQRMHISDWLPTLLGMVKGTSEFTGKIDGFDLSRALSEDLDSPREEILHNIDDIWGSAALTVGKWKIVKGTNYNGTWDDWYGPSGWNYTYDIDSVISSKTVAALKSIHIDISPQEILNSRKLATVDCHIRYKNPCHALREICLYDVEVDPCEYNNLAKTNVDVVERLEEILSRYNSTAIPPMNLPLDPRGNPIFWNNEFTNFGDFIDL